jgi:hypothetical protein
MNLDGGIRQSRERPDRGAHALRAELRECFDVLSFLECGASQKLVRGYDALATSSMPTYFNSRQRNPPYYPTRKMSSYIRFPQYSLRIFKLFLRKLIENMGKIPQNMIIAYEIGGFLYA